MNAKSKISELSERYEQCWNVNGIDADEFLTSTDVMDFTWTDSDKERLQKTIYAAQWELVLKQAHTHPSDEIPEVEEERNKRAIGGYLFLKWIGGGGFGDVYCVQQVLGKETFAIKVINEENVNKPVLVKRFMRELNILDSLRHKNIVRAYAPLEVKGRLLLVMNFIEGVSLQSFVSPDNRMLPDKALNVVRQVAEGLYYAHNLSAQEQSVIHRDIKPANIMLDVNCNAIILDFGFGKLYSDRDDLSCSHTTTGITKTGMLFGSWDYMSPEQCRDSHNVDIRTDIYALGCTFYAIVVGEPPYPDDKFSSSGAKVIAHFGEPVPSFIRKGINVRHEFELILQKMCAKQADERFRPLELINAIDDYWQQNRPSPLSTSNVGTQGNQQPVAALPKSATKKHERKWTLEDAEGVSEDCNSIIPKLKDDLLSYRVGSDQSLFPSHVFDKSISISVSSQVLCALHTTRHAPRDLHKICNAILNARITDTTNPDFLGAWRSGTDRIHTVNTAWAIYACLQSQSESFEQLQDSIRWLIGGCESDGWGFKRKMPGGIFYTALAIQALIEAYNVCSTIPKKSFFCLEIENTIKQGVQVLLNPPLHIKHILKTGGWLWRKKSDNPKYCLASTSMSIHVLAKLHRSNHQQLSALLPQNFELVIKETLYALCKILEDGIPEDKTDIKYRDGRAKLLLPCWPSFNFGESYNFHYFTPILLITILNYKDYIGKTDSVIKNAMFKTIQGFITQIKNKINQNGNSIFAPIDDAEDALWPAAQSIIVLQRWDEMTDWMSRTSNTTSVGEQL